VPAVELHDPLLHLLLVRQQFGGPQEVPVCCVAVVADLRCGSGNRDTSAFPERVTVNQHRARPQLVFILSVGTSVLYQY